MARTESPFTLQQQVQVHQGQRWEVELTYPPLDRAEADELASALLLLNGGAETFLFGDVLGAAPRGVATGIPVVSGAGQIGDLLTTAGWTGSTVEIMAPGDFFSLGAGATTRLHRVIETADSDVAGVANLRIWPSLRESPLDTAPLAVNNAKGVFRLAGTLASWEIAETNLYGIRFSAVESL
ncbi:hypothetical protein [Pelagibius sp.]|uniref:hypothetical protein n=1 Tax=Pelagibius sp. TaxID=1931238 RepID=UPI00261A8B41|nr:hypothetical protein [Pelagibius sp.]